MAEFIPIEQLSELSARLKKEGKIIVLANGAFDLFHVGHLRYLKDAKKYGDVLVVAVNSDKSIKIYKGEDRPIIPEEERIEILMSIDVVDYVTVFDEPSVERVIRALKPHYQAKGTDYTEDSVPEADLVKLMGGKVVITGDSKNHSTTDIIQKLRRVICGSQ